jgi:hypothetical protein
MENIGAHALVVEVLVPMCHSFVSFFGFCCVFDARRSGMYINAIGYIFGTTSVSDIS